MRGYRRSLLVPLGSALALVLFGCQQAAPPNAPPRAAPQHFVETVTAELVPLRTAHERTGTLRYRRTVRLQSQEQGQITYCPWFEGDRVKAGEVLLRLDERLLKAEVAKAEATTQLARTDLERIRRLAKTRAASEDELAQARTALAVAEAQTTVLRTRLSYTRIRAPFGGIITERKGEPGDVIPAHTHLLTLADPASLQLEVAVSELLLPLLKVGDPAPVRIDALGKQVFPAQVLRIHPELNPLTRQGIIEIQLTPIPETARAGQFARVTLQSAPVDRMVVPFSALRRDRSGEFVYLLRDGKAERRSVRSGLRIADSVELSAGVASGETVITRGFLGLTPGKRVEPVGTHQVASARATP